MNIFTTLEQSKRLRKAGFPQGKIETVQYYDDCDRVTAQEIMEEMRKHDNLINDIALDEVFCNWYRSAGMEINLLDMLVEAYCKKRRGNENT